MRSATLFRLFAMACLGSLATCGSGTDDGSLLVTLSSVPARAATLSLTATLNGTAAMSAQQVAPAAAQFGVMLPSGTTGHFILSIQALDTDGCVQATGKIDTTLTGKYTEVPVTLTAKSPRSCGNLAGCAAGTICAFLPKPGTNNLWGLWGSSPTDIWAVGDNSTALHYDGTGWQSAQVVSPFHYYSVWGTGPKDVWAVGQVGITIHYDGRTWTSSPNSAASDLTSVYGVSPTDVWTVGLYNSTSAQHEFWHWDGTSTWKKITTGSTTSLLSVWASAPNDITASGIGGTLIHYNGSTWSVVTTNTTNDLRSVWGTSANLVFAGGAMGTLLRNDGTGWKKIIPTGYGSNLYGLGGDKTTVYGVGNANATGNSIKGMAPFDTFAVQSSTANDLTSIIVGSNGIGWVTGKLGYLGYFDTRP